VFALQGMAPVGPYAGEITFKSNDVNNPTIQILLTGEGKSPQISVTPDHIGLTAVACPAQAMSMRCHDSASVVIQNVGLVKLTLPKVSLQPDPAMGATLPANLLLAKQVSTTSLQPGEMLEVPISWVPHGDSDPAKAEVGDFTALLVVTSNDPAQPTIKIPIKAHGDPAKVPTACVNVLSVTQRTYTVDASGRPTLQFAAVPAMKWRDPADPTTIHVRPGMKLILTSRVTKYNAMTDQFEIDTAAEQMSPCTADPQGDVLTRTWALTARPMRSGANLTPINSGTDSTIELDSVGAYTVGFLAVDSLNLRATAGFNIDAQPQDDLFAQLEWTNKVGVDLDLHLLVDQGPGITGKATPFCSQDCFFLNQGPTWFSPTTGDEIPHLIRDDQGNAGGIESTDLIKAPPGSSFRVGVHYYVSMMAGMTDVAPTVKLRHLAQDLGTFTPKAAFDTVNDFWWVATVVFPADGSGPVATADGSVQQMVKQPDGLIFGSVGACGP
jgi:hypothetical protein